MEKMKAPRVRVMVNWPHIREGVRCSSEKCALALAIRQALEKAGYSVGQLSVGAQWYCWQGLNPQQRPVSGQFSISAKAGQWRTRFDSGETVIPTRFTVQVE